MSKPDAHRTRSGGRMNVLPTALWFAVVFAFTGGSAAAQEAQAPEALVVSATILSWGDASPQPLDVPDRDPNTVAPGDVVEYRLVFTNITGQPVNNIQFTDPLPEGMHYLPGTAGADRDDVDVEFSLDGGASYSAQPMVEVVVDGRTEQRPASPEQYTDIRWNVQGVVQPNARVSAAFQVRFGPAE